MSDNRDEHGKFIEQCSLSDVRAVFPEDGEPITATEVGKMLGISNRTALNKLNELHERGKIERKKVGGRSVVWWLAGDSSDGDSPHEQAFEAFASRAMEEHGEQIEEIVLFGSTARGETRGIDSDVDIFVVVNTMEIKDTLREIAYDVMHEHGVVVAEVIKPKELVEDNPDHPLVKNVRREGRVYG